ncbi:hypothetical protein ACCD00_24155 [Pseudomonas sp. Pseusp3]|uniref:hypothetical protein n=1 Tax=Pseudomonas sp. Pseusp3 TaxID=3243029 RepID=UPI0039B0A2A4
MDINTTMCEDGEDIYISCAFNTSSDEYDYDGKVASICANSNTSPESGYVQYRYGKPSYGIGLAKVEMQYPEKKIPPKGMFTIYTSINPETIGSALRFVSGEYIYSFERFTMSGYKVVARKQGEKVFNKDCKLPGKNYLTDDAYQGLQVVELGQAKIPGANKCIGIGLREAYSSIDVDRVNACIVYTKSDAQTEGQLSRDPDGISLYSVISSGTPKLVHEFPYAGTEGKITDAFFLPVDGVLEEMLFVIHRMEVPKSWDSISDIYSVSVIRREGNTLLLDKKRTRFFDLGGDTVDEQGHSTYVYPYKDKKSVEEAVSSPLFSTITADKKITGTVLEKTFLYEGASEPLPQYSSKMYLIKGDRVLVEDSTAGWCKVSYQAKVKMITRWGQCKSIDFSAS